jgi:putative FmdB family regulatory protein
MPIYEYTCADCGSKFEVVRMIKDADTPIPCKQCKSIHTTRQISVFFAQSDGKVVAGNSSGCAGCSGGSCASCSN